VRAFDGREAGQYRRLGVGASGLNTTSTHETVITGVTSKEFSELQRIFTKMISNALGGYKS
jgi:hypothetical protein